MIKELDLMVIYYVHVMGKMLSKLILHKYLCKLNALCCVLASICCHIMSCLCNHYLRYIFKAVPTQEWLRLEKFNQVIPASS